MNGFELGFIKRAQEFGLDKYQAIELCKTAIEGKNPQRKKDAKDLIPQNFMGALGDYLTPGGFGGSRAGKATALSKSLGHKPGFSTTNPITSSTLGGGAGALGGGVLGNVLGHLTSNQQNMQDHTANGTALGVLGGGLLGSLLPAYLRRGETKKNLAEYAGGAKVHPEAPDKMRGIGNITLPFSGAHRKGEAVGYNKLRGINEDESMDTALNIGRTLPMTGLPTHLLGGITQNYSADNLIDKKK